MMSVAPAARVDPPRYDVGEGGVVVVAGVIVGVIVGGGVGGGVVGGGVVGGSGGVRPRLLVVGRFRGRGGCR